MPSPNDPKPPASIIEALLGYYEISHGDQDGVADIQGAAQAVWDALLADFVNTESMDHLNGLVNQCLNVAAANACPPGTYVGLHPVE